VTTEIQQNRYDQLIRRVGGLIGAGSKVSEVIAELFPMIDVENVPGELLALMGTRLCFGGASIAAVPLNISRLQLFNPADSGMIITLEEVYVTTQNTDSYRFGINQILLANNPNDGVFRDTRFGISNRPVGQVRNQSDNPTPAPVNGRVRQLAETLWILNNPNGVAVLSPGHGWQISPTNINSTLTATFFWRERVAETSELSF